MRLIAQQIAYLRTIYGNPHYQTIIDKDIYLLRNDSSLPYSRFYRTLKSQWNQLCKEVKLRALILIRTQEGNLVVKGLISSFTTFFSTFFDDLPASSIGGLGLGYNNSPL